MCLVCVCVWWGGGGIDVSNRYICMLFAAAEPDVGDESSGMHLGRAMRLGLVPEGRGGVASDGCRPGAGLALGPFRRPNKSFVSTTPTTVTPASTASEDAGWPEAMSKTLLWLWPASRAVRAAVGVPAAASTALSCGASDSSESSSLEYSAALIV